MAQPQPRKATWRLGARERLNMQRLAVAIICVLLFIALRPYFLGVIQGKDFQTCQSNCRKISQGIALYMQMWDDSLPPAEGWTYNVQGNMGVTSGTGFNIQHYFRCPRDHSGAPSSYAYNDLLSGISFTTRPTEKEGKAQKPAITRPERAPLIIEKYGSPVNAHLSLPDWNAVRQNLTLPHDVPPAPTGSIIFGGGRIGSRNSEELKELAGRKF
jgi:hypothetical protein